MSRKLHLIIQSIAMIGQFGVIDALPAEYHDFAHKLLAAAQSVLALWAQNYNPDGTPAAVAYLKPGPIAPDRPPRPEELPK